jgi:hypothetical protein
MVLENASVTFIACGNTQANQSKAEGTPVTLVRAGPRWRHLASCT